MPLLLLLMILMAGLVMLVVIGIRLINRIAERNARDPGQSAALLTALWQSLDHMERRMTDLEARLAARQRR